MIGGEDKEGREGKERKEYKPEVSGNFNFELVTVYIMKLLVNLFFDLILIIVKAFFLSDKIFFLAFLLDLLKNKVSFLIEFQNVFICLMSI